MILARRLNIRTETPSFLSLPRCLVSSRHTGPKTNGSALGGGDTFLEIQRVQALRLIDFPIA